MLRTAPLYSWHVFSWHFWYIKSITFAAPCPAKWNVFSVIWMTWYRMNQKAWTQELSLWKRAEPAWKALQETDQPVHPQPLHVDKFIMIVQAKMWFKVAEGFKICIGNWESQLNASIAKLTIVLESYLARGHQRINEIQFHQKSVTREKQFTRSDSQLWQEERHSLEFFCWEQVPHGFVGFIELLLRVQHFPVRD